MRRFLAGLEAAHPQVTTVLEFDPGEAAQVDFGKGPEVLDPRTGELLGTWIFIMTLAWSRHAYPEVVTDQKVATWLGCHRRAFEWFNGVPARLTIDNPKCAITRACYHDPDVQRAYAECAEGYGFKIEPCPPRDPKKKGRVESAVKYVKRSFVPAHGAGAPSEARRIYRTHRRVAAGGSQGRPSQAAAHREAHLRSSSRRARVHRRVHDREGPCSFTSNLDFSEWGDAFPNRLLGAATLDRLRHSAYRLTLEGQSYRSPRPMPERRNPAVATGGKTKK